MTSFRWQLPAALSVLLLAATVLHAQRTRKDPHIGYAFPGGGQVGTSFDVTVGGQFLKDASVAHISGNGVKVEIGTYYKPLNRGEYQSLRRKLDDTRERLERESKGARKARSIPLTEVAKAAGVTEDQLKEMEIYRKREADPKRQPNDQIVEEVTLRVQITEDAEVGERELRLITSTGMSNPIWFFVAQWPEYRETEPNDETPDPVIGDALPAIMNGQIMPGDVDRFSFRARKGMRLVISTSCRELIPYLADAVPGWFQAVLALYDAEGEEVAYAGAFYFRQDPVIYYEVPKDGEYIFEIRDSIFRGREDFVYRITIGEVPFLTGIFPMGGRAGTEVEVELQGWNLYVDRLNVRAYVDRGRPIRTYEVKQSDNVTLRVPLAIDMMTEVFDEEPNDEREQAQAITPPSVVNGRIDKPGDCDLFAFRGYGKMVAEVYGRRFGSPVDSRLWLTDESGQEVASSDDYHDEGMPLLTHHADSRILATLPGSGTYYLRMEDAQRKGGRDFIYRLHIRRPRPDWELRVVPSSIIAPPNGLAVIEVFALRREGFDDDIMLELEEAPAGFALSGAWVPSGQDRIRMTLTVPPTATKEPLPLQMIGRSQSRGRRLTHPAVPAEHVMQAFLWQHLVPAKDWTIFVSGRRASRPQLQWQLPSNAPARLAAGGSTQLRAVPTDKTQVSSLQLELSFPPDGITVESVVPEGPGIVVTINTDAEKAQPGLKGNLIFNAVRESTRVSSDGKTSSIQRSPLGILPAMPFEVVPARRSSRSASR